MSAQAAPPGALIQQLLTQEVYEQAMAGTLAIVTLFEAAQQLNDLGQSAAAIELYQVWLAANRSPVGFAARFNLAVCLSTVGNEAAAEQEYRLAIAENPNFVEPRLNLGTLLERVGRPDEAIAMWRTILNDVNPPVAGNPDYHTQTLNNLGRLLEIQRRYPEAEDFLAQSLRIDPGQVKVLTHWVHLRQKQCKWPIYEGLDIPLDKMIEGTSALAMLSVSDDPQVQVAAAQRFVDEKVVKNAPHLTDGSGYGHSRLRVGYLSSDFCSHAVSILTAELYELHDRSKVEVFGFSWTREDGSPLRARVVNAMDHYIRIDGMSDEDAARLIRNHEIDILVDLQGLTLGARPNILSYRPAPVQITYLGFPGPTALPEIDYVLADEFLLPPETAQSYTEKPLYLPDTFQINDRRREIGPRPGRGSCGLPEDVFVFCCFNNNFKYTPDVFGTWMRILQRTPGSVLWLTADNDTVKENLRRYAQEAGVDPARLIYASRAVPSEYLARFQLADLFLDTFPFNAGTTASDALWAGLPLLTYTGKSFASRMAGSLLRAVGLPELITYSLQDYEEKAVEMAGRRERVEEMKRQLESTRLTNDLFDSPRLVRNIEQLYEQVAAKAPAVPAAAELENTELLALLRPDLASIAEVGPGLAAAWVQARPGVQLTRIGNGAADAGHVEHLDDASWRELRDTQCWLFPDALQNIRDPWRLLRQIKANGRKNVEIVAAFPNAQYWMMQGSLAGGQLHYQDEGIMDRSHLRMMTRATIIELFRASGYQIVDMRARLAAQPTPQIADAIRQLAAAAGHNPQLALDDSIPYQYFVRAIAV